MSRPILEVIALDPVDAVAAQAGGADRLELVTDMAADGLTPTRETFAAVRAAVDLPLRVMLRAGDGFGAGGDAALDALCRTARELRAEGAEEFVLGFLTADGRPDLAAVVALTEAIGAGTGGGAETAPGLWHAGLGAAGTGPGGVADVPGAGPGGAGGPVAVGSGAVPTARSAPAGTAVTLPPGPGGPPGALRDAPAAGAAAPRWTFHRAIDRAADREALRKQLAEVPGLDTYLTAGSARGVDDGLPVLLEEAARGAGRSGGPGNGQPEPGYRPRIMAGGGLRLDHLPALRAAGVDAFHIGGASRPAGWSGPVDAAAVRRWREALDAPVVAVR